MCARFSDDDIEKTVENANGEVIGTVREIKGDAARVEPRSGVMDSIRAALGWDRAHEDVVTIREDSIGEITDDVIRLESMPEEPADRTRTDIDEPDRDSEMTERGEPMRERDVDGGRESGPEERSGTDELRAADESGSVDESDRGEGMHPAAEPRDTEPGTDSDDPTPSDGTAGADDRSGFEAPSAADEIVDTDSRDGLEETAASDETAAADDRDTTGPATAEGTTEVDSRSGVDESTGDDYWDDGDDGDALEEPSSPEATAESESTSPESPDETGVPDEAASTVDMADERGATDGASSIESDATEGDSTDEGRSTAETDLAGELDRGSDIDSVVDESDRPTDTDETVSTGDVDLADELDTGIDAESAEAASGTDESSTGARPTDETRDVADELDRGPDMEAVAESDEPSGIDETGGSETADEADPVDELDPGIDLESAVESDRDSGADIDPDAIAGQRTETETEAETVDRRILTDDESDVDRRPAETSADADRAALEDVATSTEGDAGEDRGRDRRRVASPLSAMFAAQRTALKQGTQTIERGLSAQQRMVQSALTGPVAIQRQQLKTMQAVTRGTLDIATAVTGAGTDATDEQLERLQRDLESSAEQRQQRLELVDGLDSMYRERLAAAGITSLDDLAQADVETVADAADVTEKRADGWIEQVRIDT